jgi:hypothetical protein
MKEAIGGFTAGIAGTVLGYPLDLLKTRMQTATGSSGKHTHLLTLTLGIIHRGKRRAGDKMEHQHIFLSIF